MTFVRTLWHRIRHITKLDDIWHYSEAVWELIKCGGRYNSDEEAQRRSAICATCDKQELDEGGYPKCSMCGCYLSIERGLERSFSKLYFPAEKCPLDKWEIKTPETE